MDIQAIGHGVAVAAKWAGIAAGILVVLVIVGSAVLPPLTRGMTDRWGATEDEIAASLPGDDAVVDAQQSATRGITIKAPAGLVMQLVRQQGYKRAGWHGWDAFYNATGSADFVDGHYSTRVVLELQDIAVGDKVFINSMVSYFVEQDTAPTTETPGVFLLYSGGNDSEPHLRMADASQAASASTTWVWVATPVSENETRLVLRIRGDMRGQGAFVAWLFDNPLDLGGALFANKTLHGIKRTAESLASRD